MKAKRNILMIILLGSTICLLHHQVGYTQSINYGIQGALFQSSLRGEDISRVASRIGGGAGIYFTVPVGPRIFVEPQLTYEIRRVQDVSSPYIPAYADRSFNLNYVTFAFITGMDQFKTGLSFFGGVGPYIGILIKGVDIDHDFYNDNDFKLIDFGGVAEGGIRSVFVDRIKMSLAFRYILGLTNIYDAGYTPDIKNNAWGIVLKISR